MLAFILSFILSGGLQQILIPSETLKATAMDYIQRNHKGDSIMVEWRSVPNSVVIPSKIIRSEVVMSTQSVLKGNIVLPLRLICENNLEQTILLSLKIRVFRSVLVSNKKIDRHIKITHEDFRSETKEYTLLADDILTDSKYLIGKRTKRIIGEDVELFQNMFEDIPVIDSGDEVTLCLKTRGVLVSTKAIANGDGKVGGAILVKKKNGSDKFRAKVISDKIVMIESE
jgi:flagella basal body P-ring formation protein FlgA